MSHKGALKYGKEMVKVLSIKWEDPWKTERRRSVSNILRNNIGCFQGLEEILIPYIDCIAVFKYYKNPIPAYIYIYDIYIYIIERMQNLKENQKNFNRLTDFSLTGVDGIQVVINMFRKVKEYPAVTRHCDHLDYHTIKRKNSF